MKISHSELESCISDPLGWITKKLVTPSNKPRTGHNQVVRLSIYKYHESNNPDLAISHLRRLLNRFKLGNLARGEDCERDLESYIEWAESTALIVAARKVRINMDLGSGWILGGEVSRIDVLPDTLGYRGIILGVDASDWKEQLRIPLLQRALSNSFRRDEAEFQIGIQTLDGSKLQTSLFSKAELDSAEASARELAKILEQEFRRMKK